MKILKDDEYNSLKQKADNYDSVVNTVTANSESLSAEDVTPDVIAEALNASTESDQAELQTQLNAAVARANTAESRVQALETENANLRSSAAGEPAQVQTEGEPSGERETIATFADNHAGDSKLIWQKAKEEGLIG